MEAGKSYKVAGWASVNEQKGKPVWEVFAKHLASGKMPAQRSTGVTLKGVDDNPGIAGLAMKRSSGYRRPVSRALAGAAMAALTVATIASARAQQAPLQDKPFAEHRVVLQLSDKDPNRQALVISVAYNLLKLYDPDKVAIEVVTFGPGIDLLRTGEPEPQAGGEPGRARRAFRRLPQYRGYHRARDRQAARRSFPPRRRCRSASDKYCR